MTAASLHAPLPLREPGQILLISCYELGHQPQGIAMPLGFLERAGYRPATLDISVEPLDLERLTEPKVVGISVPMHTALRLGVQVAARIREHNPQCVIVFYGLYASLNHDYLLSHGADFCLGGEYEGPLLELLAALEEGRREPDLDGVIRLGRPQLPVLKRLDFTRPSRHTLPPLERYAKLEHQGQQRIAGYVEASRGCLHLCTHCPIPPVYNGRFFAVPVDVVLQDVAEQVAAGATHITFGDPDFLNGPTHAVRVVRAVHEAFPQLTFDFTAKVEHLLSRGEHLSEFADAGCLFIISAVESLSDRVLTILDKNHTRADVERALAVCRQAGIVMRPTWVAFTPWTTYDDYLEVLEFVHQHDLVDHIDPVQHSIRLLIPPGSWLAEHPETLPHRGPLDEAALTYRWKHPDPAMDALQREVAKLVEEDAERGVDPTTTFYRIWQHARGEPVVPAPRISVRAPAPRMTETWFC